MRVKIPLFGSGTQAKALQLSPQTIINLYPVSSFGSDGQKSNKALYKRPGTSLFSSLPNMGKVRGLLEYRNELFVVSGNRFYVVGAEGNSISLGTLLTTEGPIKIINNGLQLMMDDGVKGYTYTFSTAVFAQIADADYIPSGFVTCSGLRAVYTQPNTNVFWISSQLDFTAYADDDFATAESIPQNLVCAYANQSDLFLFGSKLTEAWVNTGDGLFPFEKRVGVNIPYGCAAKFSIAEANNSIIWLAKNDQGKALLMTLNGYVPRVLADEHDCYQLNQLTEFDDIVAFVFQLNGHIFYVMNCPTDNKTFVYDVANEQLVEWSSWYDSGDDKAGNPIYINGRFIGEHYAFFDNKHIVSDYRGNGKLLELSDSTVVDYSSGPDNSIYWEVIGPIVSKDNTNIRINAITPDMALGVSPLQQTDSVNDPLINVALSKDGGNTFGKPRQHTYGFGGDYRQSPRLNLWGLVKNGAIKLFGNHSSFVGLFDVYVDIDLEASQYGKTG